MTTKCSASLASVLLLLAIPGYCRTFHVETNGQQSDTCGSRTDPCRSIRLTIFQASAGDEIVVGPGEYHDESAGTGMIIVGKRLSIVSRRGAAETIINVGDPLRGAVIIEVTQEGDPSYSVFGKRGHGFTVVGHSQLSGGIFSGISVDPGVLHVTVEGNVVTGFERGFSIAGAEGIVAFNASIGNGTGFDVGDAGGYGNLVKNNVANANSAAGGIVVRGDGQIVSGNIVNANIFTGIRVSGIHHRITGNSVLGNINEGVLIDPGSEATVTGNNLYGTFNNCGLANNGNAGIDGSGNYWGAASGPGAPPADNVCNIGGATTDVSGFLRKPVNVRLLLEVSKGARGSKHREDVSRDSVDTERDGTK